MPASRTVFFVSDGTGITAETLGHSLLSQFESIAFRQQRIPFVDSVEKAQSCLAKLEEARIRDGVKPIVVSTLVNPAVASLFHGIDAVVLNFFETFIAPLETELGQRSTHTIGRSHGTANSKSYLARIEAINFTMAHDDGVTDKDLDQSDVILVGVSRSGKTPTSLYLALQFGVKAANYPLIPEDFERRALPDVLRRNRGKLFGLTISPDRLNQIRSERRPDSRYASIENCRWEIEQAQKLLQREGIRWLDSTSKSIEEIAATLIDTVGLERNGF
ncbi:MAG TPA: pyruvate, water dikinase regulatory protein [Rhodocyclaceae bacterium]